ncbi:hypothetical protein [Streptomyces sp. NPDC058603]|uniref:hypothetical protein n=1 Tax=Streptomyces sp. NPDC058603 TaxID=3346551 RepID=UPI003648C48C
MTAESADGPAVHHDRETSVVVLEYVVHGRAVAMGRPYHNHFVPVITIRDRDRRGAAVPVRRAGAGAGS